jgi:hypothetical protein
MKEKGRRAKMIRVTVISEGALTQQVQITVHQVGAEDGRRREARSPGAPRLPDRPRGLLRPGKPNPKEDSLRWNTRTPPGE